MAAIDKLAGFAEHFREDAARDDEFASAVMIRNGIPEDIVQRAATVSSAFRAWGAKAKVTRPLTDGETLELATAAWRSCTGPATRPPTPSSGTRSGGS